MILTNSPTYWQQMLKAPVAQRLQQAPEELVNFIAQHNAATQSDLQPHAASISADMLSDIGTAIAELPAAIQRLLEPRLLGVFFMHGLGAAAITNLIAYTNGDLLGAAVAIDVDIFSDKRANDWATWRENTAFASDPEIRLAVCIADNDKNDRIAALQYALLHEFGHVLATASDAMPAWWKENQVEDNLQDSEFARLGWQLSTDRVVTPRADGDFALRKKIQFYGTARLAGSDIPSVYENLDKTIFPTLYAATDMHKDFAESFTTYVHTVLLKKPHTVSIYRDEKLIATYESFWHSPRSKAKAAFFEAFLAHQPQQFARYRQHALMAELCSHIIDNAATKFLGLAPFLRASTDCGDLRHVADELLKQISGDQGNAFLWMNVSTTFLSVNQHAVGLSMQQEGLRLRRQFFLPASEQPARCHALLIMAPGDLAENMPLDCLFEFGAVDLTIYYATAEKPLPDEIPDHDVLVVALSDTEKNSPILQVLKSVLAAWDKPVINQPQFIPNVERSAASVLLQDIPGLLMPLTYQTSRISLDEFVQESLPLKDAADNTLFPIILRPVGSHAGRNLDRINDVQGLEKYLTAVPDSEFYLSRFIDYSGTDGLFRKFRIALIDGEPFISHMAISSHWMIHYVNAGMYINGEKRIEEGKFMDNFEQFVAKHRTALDAIAQRIGLDYLCIDCGETRDGELLIFEVDHAMVVHAMDPEDLFPYKQKHILKARQAVTDLFLRRMTTSTDQRQLARQP